MIVSYRFHIVKYILHHFLYFLLNVACLLFDQAVFFRALRLITIIVDVLRPPANRATSGFGELSDSLNDHVQRKKSRRRRLLPVPASHQP